jgi:hypothetical protein
MIVFSHIHLPREQQPGVQRRCVAARAQGVQGFEAWHYIIDAGAEAVFDVQAEETVLLAGEGVGKLELACGPQRLQSPCTVKLPAHQQTRLVNIGATAIKLLLVCTAASPAAAGQASGLQEAGPAA